MGRLLALALVVALHGGALAWRFTDVTAAAGVGVGHGWLDPEALDQVGLVAAGVAAGDFDGDGFVDLYVVGGDAGANHLLRNRGDGTFEDVADAAGLDTVDRDTISAAFGDYDRDGDLDLFLTHWGTAAGIGSSQHLWRNDGGMHFTDVSVAAGVTAAWS